MNLNALTLSELIAHAEQSDDPLIRRLVDAIKPFEHADPDDVEHARKNAELAAELETYDILDVGSLRTTLDTAERVAELAEKAASELETLSRCPVADLGGLYDRDDLRLLAALAADIERAVSGEGGGDDSAVQRSGTG